MLGIVGFLTSKWRMLAVVAGALFMFFAGWRTHQMIVDAAMARSLRESIEKHTQQQDESHQIGVKLETGVADYKATTRELNRRVQDATIHNNDNRFDADSVQRTADRIAAGEAARKRAE